jgi:hypothetical protein
MANWMGYHLTSYTKTGEVIKVTDLSGFAWKKGDGKVFNWHPLLMTFGFVFCSTQAALVYISLPFSHETNKVRHCIMYTI